MREHRGDGHVTALVACGIGGTESHVLHALSDGMPASSFGRVSHLPAAQLASVIEGMRARGLVADDGWLTDEGHRTKQQVEDLTDRLAAPAYEVLDADERAVLAGLLEPVAAALSAARWSAEER